MATAYIMSRSALAGSSIRRTGKSSSASAEIITPSRSHSSCSSSALSLDDLDPLLPSPSSPFPSPLTPVLGGVRPSPMLDTLSSVDLGRMSRNPNSRWQPSCTTSSAPSLYPSDHPPAASSSSEELFSSLAYAHDLAWSTDPFAGVYTTHVEEPSILPSDHDLYPAGLDLPFSGRGLRIVGGAVRASSSGPGSTAPVAPVPAPITTLGSNLELPDPSFISRPPSAHPSHRSSYSRTGTSKRPREDESSVENTPPVKRRAKSIPTPDLNEEERLLLQLKDDEGLPWKDIALRFQTDLGKAHQVPALQMRYKRLREKLRPWTEADIHALQQAHDYWAKNKWEIISNKMMDYGSVEKWPGKYCARKWGDLHPGFDLSKESMVASPGRIGDYSDRDSPDIRLSRLGTPGDDRSHAI